MVGELRKPVIGLIGGIGSGKSLVASQLQDLDCGVIDADQLARVALDERGVKAKLLKWWGLKILDCHGGIDRLVVAGIVFADPDKRQRLEGIIHPIVHHQRMIIGRQYANNPQVVAVVEDCPLLLEVGLDKQCDTVIFIDTPRPIRLARLAASRGWSEQDLAQREKHQIPLDKKIKSADYIVVNNATKAECLTHVRGVLSQILRLGNESHVGN